MSLVDYDGQFQFSKLGFHTKLALWKRFVGSVKNRVINIDNKLVNAQDEAVILLDQFFTEEISFKSQG